MRDYATTRADDVLSGYGYTRGPSTTTQIITHVASFGLGVGLGAGIGLLVAPRAGEETREQLKTSATDAYEKVLEFVDTQVPSTEVDQPNEEPKPTMNGRAVAQA